MNHRTMLVLLPLVLGACAGAQHRPESAGRALTPVAESRRQWTGVTTAGERIFVNFPRWSDDVPISVGELKDGGVAPWPDATWNSWTPGAPADGRFVAVQSVVAEGDSLWVVDTANPKFGGVVERGPRLFLFDVRTGDLQREFAFGPEVVSRDSYLNDVRVDRARQTAYLTDSGAGGLVVVDLASGTARKVLADHPSTHAETDHLEIDGHRFDRAVNADGIALSPGAEWLYYAPLTGHTLWRVPTAALRDPEADPAARVERVRHIVATDGILMAPDGNLYLGGLEDFSVYVLRPDGGYERLVHDRRLSWPDTFALDESGDLLVTTTQLQLPAGEQGPFGLWRIDLPARGAE